MIDPRRQRDPLVDERAGLSAEGVWQSVLALPDPYGALVGAKEAQRLYFGDDPARPNVVRFGSRQTHLLVLAPPRSMKTASVIVPNVLLHHGPCVVVSSRFEIALPTAMLRALQGEVIVFNPAGDRLPPGFSARSWTPIAEASTWAGAVAVAKSQVAVSRSVNSSTGERNAQFWDNQASKLLSCYYFYANRAGRGIDWVYRQVVSANFSAVGTSPRPEDPHVIMERAFESAGELDALAVLRGIRASTTERILDSYATADMILAPYARPEALHAATDPPLDLDAFVSGAPAEPTDLQIADGRPLLGRYATIYITASVENQRQLAPIIVSFLNAIRDRVFARNHAEQIDGQPRSAPVLFALDELYNMAPLPDLPGMLTQGGSQGLQIVGALQSPAQAVDRWGEQGRALLALWQNVMIFRGLGDDFLGQLSRLYGDADTDDPSTSEQRAQRWGPGGLPLLPVPGTGRPVRSTGVRRLPRLPIDWLQEGIAEDPFATFTVFAGGSAGWIRATPYFRSAPWPQLILAAARRAIRLDSSAAHLPPPDLARDGDVTSLAMVGGEPLVTEWRALLKGWRNSLNDAL